MAGARVTEDNFFSEELHFDPSELDMVYEEPKEDV